MSVHHVLFLCKSNSARSIMAEAILNAKAHGQSIAHSAGTDPSGEVRPEALSEISSAGVSIDGLRTKSRDEFTTPGAPKMDFVFCVCDTTGHETCPEWPVSGEVAHWDIPDPTAASGTPEEISRAFHDAFTLLDRRINLLLALPASALDEVASHHSDGNHAIAA